MKVVLDNGAIMPTRAHATDAGYTGSIVVKLYNNSGYDYTVNKGDKISQIVLLPIFTPELEQAENLDNTERGAGGFGSSGK